MRATHRGESALLMQDVVDVLQAKSIEYAVIGALAGAVHGVIRATTDADAVVRIATAEAASLRDALTAQGFSVELARGGFEDPIAGVLKLKDELGNRVELLFGIKGMDPGAYSRAITHKLNGENLRFISREDYIAMKLGAGSPLDVRDATGVFKVNRDNIEPALLKTLCTRFGADAVKKLESLLNLPAPGTSDPGPSP